MAYKILYPQSSVKRAAAFARKPPDLLKQDEKTLQLLESNPFHPSLRLHPLSGKLHGLLFVSITTRDRIAMEIIIHEENIILVNVGTHEDVY